MGYDESTKPARHRVWAEINLDNLVFNFRQLQALVGDSQIACVVKGNSYGHGAVQFAKTLCEHGATFFAVSTGEEALQLRRHDITQPVLVLGMVNPALVRTLAQQNISLTVGSSEMALAYAEELGERRLRIHIKVETGLNRIGFAVSEAAAQTLKIAEMPCFLVEGIYSHFAVSENETEDERSFTQHQHRLFADILTELESRGLHIPLRHIANSAALLVYPESYKGPMFNMVRPGVLLCGFKPTPLDEVELRPVLSWHTSITQLKTIAVGESVGYGRTWHADRETKVATIGIGYCDGLARQLSGKVKLLVRGQRVPQIGRIAMDMTMIDVTDVDGVRVGDRVTLIGRDGEEQITAEEASAAMQSLPNELLSGIGLRVPRLFLRDGKVVEEVSYLA